MSEAVPVSWEKGDSRRVCDFVSIGKRGLVTIVIKTNYCNCASVDGADEAKITLPAHFGMVSCTALCWAISSAFERR